VRELVGQPLSACLGRGAGSPWPAAARSSRRQRRLQCLRRPAAYSGRPLNPRDCPRPIKGPHTVPGLGRVDRGPTAEHIAHVVDDRVPGTARPQTTRYECPVCGDQAQGERPPTCSKDGVEMTVMGQRPSA